MNITINPIEECARAFWNDKLVPQHRKYNPDWEVPNEWGLASKDSKIITMSNVLDFVNAKTHVTMDDMHGFYVAGKYKAGFRLGEHNLRNKTHPMLKPLQDCPEYFREIAFFFCDNVIQWTSLIKEYQEEMEK